MKDDAEKFKQLADEERKLKEILGTSEVDFTNKKHVELFALYNIPQIVEAYKEYEVVRRELEAETKYSDEYKKTMKKELKDNFIKYKQEELFRSRERVARMRGQLEALKNIENNKQDPILRQLEKANLLLMLEHAITFQDTSFLKSLIQDVMKYDDLLGLLKNKIAGTEKEIIMLDIDKLEKEKNEIYLNLDMIDEKLQVMMAQKDMMFTNIDIRESKWFKIM